MFAKHKNKIIVAVVAVAVLACAWFFGGNYVKDAGDPPGSRPSPATQAHIADEQGTAGLAADSGKTTETDTQADMGQRDDNSGDATAVANTQNDGETAVRESVALPGTDEDAGAAETAAAPATDDDVTARTPEQDGDVGTDAPAFGGADATQEGARESAEQQGNGLDATAQEQVSPVEPGDATDGDAFTVTLTVRCVTVLDNMDLLKKDKRELVPDDGLIFHATEVTAYHGESLFNVFLREMKKAKIHMAFRNTPIYNSAYIEAVNNLYAFDAGELSGWMYCVNGAYPSYGCSRYLLEPGDEIVWNYTCDLGRDLGRNASGGWQLDD